jgi:hypothetical protein
MCENRITPLLEEILDAVVTYSADCGLPSWCREGLVAGAAAWDVCCDCGDGSGQLWVRLIGWESDPKCRVAPLCSHSRLERQPTYCC